MIQRFHKTGATFAMTVGFALLAPVALAQTQSAAPPQQTPAGTPAAQAGTGPTPSDTELKNFAHAALGVEGIRQSLQPKLSAAKTPDDRTKIKQDAEKQMETAVKTNHLSLQRYVQIANVVQQDSAMRAKVQSFMPPKPSKS